MAKTNNNKLHSTEPQCAGWLDIPCSNCYSRKYLCLDCSQPSLQLQNSAIQTPQTRSFTPVRCPHWSIFSLKRTAQQCYRQVRAGHRISFKPLLLPQLLCCRPPCSPCRASAPAPNQRLFKKVKWFSSFFGSFHSQGLSLWENNRIKPDIQGEKIEIIVQCDCSSTDILEMLFPSMVAPFP